jgi:selenocysteine lyase/cysteine desulfurase
MEAPLSCQRAAFALPPNEHYLNCAYMSPLPRRVEAAGIHGVRRKRVPHRIRPRDFFEESDRVRQLFARLIGAPEAERIALMPAVSYGMATVAQNLALGPGQNVVMVEEQFPSNVYAWHRLADDTGAEIRIVPAPEGPNRGARWNERMLEAIDNATGLVTAAPVHWADGTRFDLEAIGRRARDVGAAFVVDGTQSVGALPFDVEQVRPDALVCAAYKWLLGPYGIALAYLGPRFDDGQPLEETWIGRRGSEDFGGLIEYEDAYQLGAARYDMGERSNPILLPMVATALEMVLEWDPARIQTYCEHLTADPVETVRSLGLQVEEAAWRGAHLFGVRLPAGVSTEALQAALTERQVNVSVRGSAIRIAPNVYNNAADVDALVAVLQKTLPSARTA